MTSKMRFGKQVKAGHTGRLRELMPQGITDDSQFEIGHDFYADATNCFDIAKEVCRTAFRIHQPLSANIHDNCLRNSDDER